MRYPLRTSSTIAAAVAALAIGALSAPLARSQEKQENTYPGSIKIEYEVPKDPAMQKAYDMATEPVRWR